MLANEARKSEKAYRKLVAETNKAVTEANKRLRELEKAGYQTQAYKKAQYYIKKGGERRSRYQRTRLKDNQPVGSVLYKAQQAKAFLELKTSTVQGYEQSLDESLDTITTRYGDIKNKELFKEYLKSDFFKRYVEGNSDEAFTFGIDNIENTDDLIKLQDLYEQFEQGNLYIDDIVVDWKEL